MKIVTLTSRHEFPEDVSDEDAVASAIEVQEQEEWNDDQIKIDNIVPGKTEPADKEMLDWLESLPEKISIGRRDFVFQRLLYLEYPESTKIRDKIKELMLRTDEFVQELNR